MVKYMLPRPRSEMSTGPAAKLPSGLAREGRLVATRVATRPPSLASPDGSFAAGPVDISLRGRGNMYLTIGYGGNPDSRTTALGPAGLDFARLARASAGGGWNLVEDLGAYEAAANPAG